MLAVEAMIDRLENVRRVLIRMLDWSSVSDLTHCIGLKGAIAKSGA